MKLVCQLVALAAVMGCIDGTDSHLAAGNSTKFLLYTLANPSTPQELKTGDLSSVNQSNFNSNKPTKIIIHGWTKSAQEIPNPELRTAYLAAGDYNLISVDWQKIAALDYISSRYSVSDVGASIAAFIDFLNQYAGMSFESVVVIGHSLGAHCAGYAGKLVTRGRLPYIVGLDPAGPFFSYSDPNTRLNSTDADYVVTIQTDRGVKGIAEPIGSASFFANGGIAQPGCGMDLEGSCAHSSCVRYFADAIRGFKFTPIYECSSFFNTPIITEFGCRTEVPGLDIGDPTTTLRSFGVFYFKTNSEEPYGHV